MCCVRVRVHISKNGQHVQRATYTFLRPATCTAQRACRVKHPKRTGVRMHRSAARGLPNAVVLFAAQEYAERARVRYQTPEHRAVPRTRVVHKWCQAYLPLSEHCRYEYDVEYPQMRYAVNVARPPLYRHRHRHTHGDTDTCNTHKRGHVTQDNGTYSNQHRGVGVQLLEVIIAVMLARAACASRCCGRRLLGACSGARIAAVGLLEMVADAVAALGVAEVSALAVTERTVNVPAASKPLKKSAVKAFLDRSFRALGLAITPPTRDPPFLSSTGVESR